MWDYQYNKPQPEVSLEEAIETFHRLRKEEVMNHEIALNLMLSENCPQQERTDDGINTYYFEGHCVAFTVTAKLISTVDTIQYEILDITVEDN